MNKKRVKRKKRKEEKIAYKMIEVISFLTQEMRMF